LNLIITCSRRMEDDAAQEISSILEDIGDSNIQTEKTDFSGVIVAHTNLDPFLIIRKIKQMIIDDPWKMRYCLRFIPIEKFTETRIGKILDAVKELTYKIKPNETYRITIQKRGSELSSKELIESIANVIDNKVSLDNFDWNIIIEILGDICGIVIARNEDVISTLKLKRDSTE
jgi:tRNA acetyltransferase TAN1